MPEYLLPDVGEGLTEAEIVAWKVKVGDVIAINDIVVEIETAKSLVELPSPYAGTVTALLVNEGETIAVGTPIIAIGDGSEAAAPGAVGDADRRDRPVQPGRQRRRRGREPGRSQQGRAHRRYAAPVGARPRPRPPPARRPSSRCRAPSSPGSPRPTSSTRPRRTRCRPPASAPTPAPLSSGPGARARQAAGAQARQGPRRRPGRGHPDRRGWHGHPRRRPAGRRRWRRLAGPGRRGSGGRLPPRPRRR